MNYNPPDMQEKRKNRAVFGLLVLLAGVAILLRKMGLFPYINIKEYWPFFLIILGFFIGIQKRFTKNAWWILMLIGIINLIPRFSFTVGDHLVRSRDLVTPTFLIVGGLLMILRPRRDFKWEKFQQPQMHNMSTDTLNSDVVFGGRKEVITSRNFKGGNVTAVFGGCEINLLQADIIQNTVVLTVRAVFGGIEVIVPSNWEVKSEVETIFGSTQDERSIRMQEQNPDNKKTLILRGSCVFGGVEIKSI